MADVFFATPDDLHRAVHAPCDLDGEQRAVGIEATARLNKLLLALQLILLAVFVVLGVIALSNGAAGAHLSLAPLWDPAKVTPGLIFGALSLAALSFLGFDAISLTGAQAGIRTDTTHRRARIVAVDPSRAHRELAAGRIVV